MKKSEEASQNTEDKEMTLVEHLEELRRRIISSLIVIAVMSILVYFFSDTVLAILAKPIGKLVFIAPQEAFITRVKIAIFGGLFLSSPFVIYQIWKFVSAGLYPREKKYIGIFGPLSFLFFILGVVFGYFVIVPIGMKFLLGFAGEFLTPMITIGRYISFVGLLTLAFGVVFQLPLVILFLTKIGVVTPVFLSRRRREAIAIIFILGAVLTPPDVVTQVLMAFPLIILYELGIIFSKLAYRKNNKR